MGEVGEGKETAFLWVHKVAVARINLSALGS